MMMMASFKDYYNFLLLYSENFAKYDLSTWFMRIFIALFFIVFCSRTRNTPVFSVIFIVYTVFVVILVSHVPYLKVTPTFAIFFTCITIVILTKIIEVLCVFVRYLRKNQMTSRLKEKQEKLDYSATFESPEEGRMRPMIISNINKNSSSKELRDFLLSDSSLFLPFKINGNQHVTIEFSTTKPSQESKTAILTILYSHSIPGGLASVSSVALCILQKHNKEFKGRKLHIKEIHSHKEILQKHHKKWTFDNTKKIYKKGREDKLRLANVWSGYPEKTYTSVDGGSIVFDNCQVGDIIDRASSCGVEKIVMICTSLKDCRVGMHTPAYI
ncbi:hypothetical protein KUTeg_005529 [Tegillarca granosa]|uniref:Uncharacterized protein n=1 Tax=Tegillarca granosa TaxID=220873 RepID=A0ABQ9FPI0_TEGGR|nr:hypothetical protein KUTeg_005529 [Tegillarca granosa]